MIVAFCRGGLIGAEKPSSSDGLIGPPDGASDEDDNGYEPEDDDLRRLTMTDLMGEEEMEHLRLHRFETGVPSGSSTSNDVGRPTASRKRAAGPAPLIAKKQKGLGGMLAEEMQIRKREALGMVGPGKTLGGAKNSTLASSTGLGASEAPSSSAEGGSTAPDLAGDWSCGVCTLWVFSSPFPLRHLHDQPSH